MFYFQFKEGEAYLYTEEEWFLGNLLLSNMRRAKIDTPEKEVAEKAFDKLALACYKANPTIDWSGVPDTVQEF